jgi:hypothetical protein
VSPSIRASRRIEGDKWFHKPGDVGDITPGIDCGVGFW